VGVETSTFLGLPEIHRAAEMLEQPARVHLWVRPAEVAFELSMRVNVPSQLTESAHSDSQGEDGAAGHVHCAHGVCGHHPPGGLCERGCSVVGGAPSLPNGLVFVCCDDDDMPRIYADSVLLPAAKADREASLIVGETYEEAVGVPDLVMTLAERHGHDQVIGVFDQNLTNYHEGEVFGTELCRELRQRGFTGVLVIQSANDEVGAEREYLAAGADGCVGKVIRGGPKELVDRLAQLRQHRLSTRH